MHSIATARLGLVSYWGFASYLVITENRIKLKLIGGRDSLKSDQMPELVSAATIELAFVRSILGSLFGIAVPASSLLPSFSTAASEVLNDFPRTFANEEVPGGLAHGLYSVGHSHWLPSCASASLLPAPCSCFSYLYSTNHSSYHPSRCQNSSSVS